MHWLKRWIMAKDAFELRRFVTQHFVGRISSELSDPGYRNYRALIDSGYDIRVFLNEDLQDGYLAADVEEGIVRQRVLLRSSPRIEVRRGTVRIAISKQPKTER
jgi:hypothetical protein